MDDCYLSLGATDKLVARPFFVPKRQEPDFQPIVASPAFVLALANRVHEQSELLSRRAERRAVIVSEVDYQLE